MSDAYRRAVHAQAALYSQQGASVSDTSIASGASRISNESSLLRRKSQGCWCKYATSSRKGKICPPHKVKCCVRHDPPKGGQYKHEEEWLAQHLCQDNVNYLPLGLPTVADGSYGDDDELRTATHIDTDALWVRACTVLSYYGLDSVIPLKGRNFGMYQRNPERITPETVSKVVLNEEEFNEIFRPQVEAGFLSGHRVLRLFRAVTYQAQLKKHISGFITTLEEAHLGRNSISHDWARGHNYHDRVAFEKALRDAWYQNKGSFMDRELINRKLFRIAYTVLVSLLMHWHLQDQAMPIRMLQAAGYSDDQQDRDWKLATKWQNTEYVHIAAFNKLFSPDTIQDRLNSDDANSAMASRFKELINGRKKQPNPMGRGLNSLVVSKFTHMGKPDMSFVYNHLVRSVVHPDITDAGLSHESERRLLLSKTEFSLAAFVVRSVYIGFEEDASLMAKKFEY